MADKFGHIKTDSTGSHNGCPRADFFVVSQHLDIRQDLGMFNSLDGRNDSSPYILT